MPDQPAKSSTPRDPIDELLLEVSALAMRLRQQNRRDKTPNDLPSGGDNVLTLLGRHTALTVPQIAHLNSTSRQNIQIIINRLSREGCVELAQNPAHKRSELVRLTDRGYECVQEIKRKTAGNRQKLLGLIPIQEVAGACELLRRIRDALGAPKPSEPSTERLQRALSSKDTQARKRAGAESGKAAPPIKGPESLDEEKIVFETEDLPVSLL